nr:Ty3/gypsy retrotransposon protein [Tanacetum cinerariifolium]
MPPRRDPPSLEESMASLADSMAKLLVASSSSATQLETINSQLVTQSTTTANLLTAITKLTPDEHHPLTPPPVNPNHKSPKIQLPTFDGTFPLDWLFQADQYFAYYSIPAEQRVSLVSFHFQGILGFITADFSIPQLTFKHLNKTVTLRGESVVAEHATPSTLCHLFQKQSIASYFAIVVDPLTGTQEQSSAPMANDLANLLQRYAPIFDKPTCLPLQREHDHHINLLPNTIPVNVRPYQYPHFQKEAMTELITEMLQDVVIKPSTSPYSSPILLVRKKDGSWRFCVDYHALNAVTVRDRFPIPTVDELLDKLHGSRFFTKIDLRSGYHQIRVAATDTHKTSFRTIDGHYEFLVMPFGLSNILVYSPTRELHMQHLESVLETLASNHYYAKRSKCVFAEERVQYLGHVISGDGVSVDNDKIRAIFEWQTPNSVSKLHGFLGLTGYYRWFVRNYATVATPLTDLLQGKKFSWTAEATDAFTTLKKAMTTLPTLALPGFSKPFEVTTDTSEAVRKWRKNSAFLFNHIRRLQILLSTANSPHEHPTYCVHDGLLYRTGRIVVPAVSDLRQRVITKYHATPTVGHSELYRLHGLPKSVVSDRDPLFLSCFWQELFKQLGTTLRHSSAYHPQTDGKSEVVNRCLESYLRCFASDELRTWQRSLYLAEFWYNTNHHIAIASIDETLIVHRQLLDQLKETLDHTRLIVKTQWQTNPLTSWLSVSFVPFALQLVLVKWHIASSYLQAAFTPCSMLPCCENALDPQAQRNPLPQLTHKDIPILQPSAIIGSRTSDGIQRVLVSWKGCDPSE